MNFQSIKIFGTRLDKFSRLGLKNKIIELLNGPPRRIFVTTPNPEILLKARQDENYRQILNRADLNICDGVGVQLIARLRGQGRLERFAGADLVQWLFEEIKRRKLNVLVVVSKNSLSSPAAITRSLREKFGVDVSAEYFEATNFFANEIARKAQVIFVNFGAPDQEVFIDAYRNDFPSARILLGVGGAFDFFTGRISRAPIWMRKIGLEWLWRLILEPRRAKRIWSAVCVFPILALISTE